jgi:hypothetical protein
MNPSEKTPPQNSEPNTTKKSEADSLGIPVKKSPILIYALLQIPIVIIMVVILYFAYKSRQGQ